MEEREHQPRSHQRHKTLKPGLISYDNGRLTVPCLVRDFSEAGARLKFAMPVALPDTFHLTIPLDGDKYPAEMKWKQGTTCGVHFTGPALPSNLHHSQYIAPSMSDAPAVSKEQAADRPEPVVKPKGSAHKIRFGRLK